MRVVFSNTNATNCSNIEKEVIPTERLYHPVLMALVKRCDYLVATDLLEHARVQNVEFSFDVQRILLLIWDSEDLNCASHDMLQMYQQLLDVAGHQGEGSDAYESFMTYVEEALSENDTVLPLYPLCISSNALFFWLDFGCFVWWRWRCWRR